MGHHDHRKGKYHMNAALEHRTASAPIDPRFMTRWSPRAFHERAIPDTVLESLFEAARWAPSSFNEQPWHFHITTRGAARDELNEAIFPFNRAWSDAAPAIIFITARRTLAANGKPNAHAWFDAGAATLQLVMQAQEHGLVAHAMGGIDAARAHALLKLDEDTEVVAALAIGFAGDPAALPENLREREQPSTRKPLHEVYTEVQ